MDKEPDFMAIVLAAYVGAILALAIWYYFGPEEPPRIIMAVVKNEEETEK